jgi:V8-like Glu-specific endopeptidase
VTNYILKPVGAAVLVIAASCAAMAQSQAPAEKPPNTVKLTVTCYWQNYEQYWLDKMLDSVSKSNSDQDYGGCSKYVDPTHCERTQLEMYLAGEKAKPGKGDWERVIGNRQIFTLRCSKPCKNLPMMGDSFEAETDGKWMWIRFEKPDRKDIIQAFEVADVSPMKEEAADKVEPPSTSEPPLRSQIADTPPEKAVGQSDSPRTPAQILDENRGAVAVIVAAGDTSTKLGTGVFLRSSGLLLTNLHVVEDTELVGVKLPGRSDILWAKNARGFDSDNDLAILEVEVSGVGTVALGDSDNVRVGEPIVVVSNPEGLEQTVSNGLISGIRDLDGRKLFQITAPISEGSSGGPVFNERGEVIGVVVASLESGQNLNFAIPINYAKPLLQHAPAIPIATLPRKKIDENKPVSTAAPPTNPDDFPKSWKHALNGLGIRIRIQGDYLYEEREAYTVQSEGHDIHISPVHCEMKRTARVFDEYQLPDGSRHKMPQPPQPGEWVGECRYMVNWAPNFENGCAVDTLEVVTSVTATRIEGRSQALDYSTTYEPRGSCPKPKNEWYEFALIPTD